MRSKEIIFGRSEMGTVIDIAKARARRHPPKAEVVCESATVGTVTCHRCGGESIVAADANGVACPICGDRTARFEPFERAIEWVPVSMFRVR